MEILKELLKLRFHVIILIGGLLLLYLAIFSSFPSPDNGWSPDMRQSPNVALSLISIVLIGASMAIHFYFPESADSPRFLFARNIKREYDKSSATQKEVLRVLHELHKKEVSLEDFYSFIQKKHGPDLVKTEDELYFRLKDLSHKRLLSMKPVGKNASVLQPLQKVGRVLNFPSE